MIMVDTNILIDLRDKNSDWYGWSLRHISEAQVDDRVTISVIVIGELASSGTDIDTLSALMADYNIKTEPLPVDGAFIAGKAHHAYRKAGGTRDKLLGDFLIGGHAVAAKASLLTRDARRYRRYLPDLTLITPETDNG